MLYCARAVMEPGVLDKGAVPGKSAGRPSGLKKANPSNGIFSAAHIQYASVPLLAKAQWGEFRSMKSLAV